jgi:hypothetical protein
MALQDQQGIGLDRDLDMLRRGALLSKRPACQKQAQLARDALDKSFWIS